MIFIFIAAGAIGGGIGGLCLLTLLVIWIRSIGVKWVDSIGINFLTSQKSGYATVVQNLITFQYLVTCQSFIKRWASVLASYPALTHVIKNRRFLWSYYDEKTEFDINKHVFSVDEPLTMEEITQYAQKQELNNIKEPLQDNLPLWRIIIFSHLKDSPDGQSVMLFRYHRCLADSITMMQMLLTESQYIPAEEVSGEDNAVKISMNSSDSASTSTSAHSGEEALSTEIVDHNPLLLMSTEKEREMYPEVFSETMEKHCGARDSLTGSYWRLVCTKKDSPNPMRTKKSVDAVKERFMNFKVLDVKSDELAKLANHDMTINDAILGCIFNAVHVHCYSKFIQMKTKSTHSMLWVNRRSHDFIYTPITDRDHISLSNKDSSAVILNVPLNVEGAWQNMVQVHHQLWLKSKSREPSVVQSWLRIWGWLPRNFGGDACFSSFMRRASFSINVVPGPQEIVSLNGNPITSIVNSVPPLGNEESHFSILCYNNKITISFVANGSLFQQDDVDDILRLCNDGMTSIKQTLTEEA